MKNCPISNEALRELYVAPMSLRQLSIRIGADRTVIKRWLLNADITLRDLDSVLKIVRDTKTHQVDEREASIPAGFRQCRNPACKSVLVETDMIKQTSRSRPAWVCKTCESARFAAYRSANLEKVRANARESAKRRYAAKKAATSHDQ